MDAYIEQIARGEISMDSAPTERLGCCEYVRTSDGQVRSVLQCFCECDAVDETASNMLSQGQMPNSTQIRRIEQDIADRIRLPWITGAVRLNPWLLVLPVALYVEMWLARAVGSSILVPCISFLFFLYNSIVFMRAADTARSKIFCFFTFWAIIQVVTAYFSILRHTVSAQYDMVAAVLVATIAFSAWHIHFGDPGRMPELSAPANISKEGLAMYYIGNGLLRAKWCRITDTAIAEYDHFCIWLGAPIGKRNHAAFLLFLVNLSFGGVLFFWKAHSTVNNTSFSSDESDRTQYLLLCSTRALVGALGCIALLLRQIYLISAGMTTYEYLHRKTLLLHAKQLESKFPSNVWGRGRWQEIWHSSQMMHSFGREQ